MRCDARAIRVTRRVQGVRGCQRWRARTICGRLRRRSRAGQGRGGKQVRQWMRRGVGPGHVNGRPLEVVAGSGQVRVDEDVRRSEDTEDLNTST